jgi:hypothetical protein
MRHREDGIDHSWPADRDRDRDRVQRPLASILISSLRHVPPPLPLG